MSSSIKTRRVTLQDLAKRTGYTVNTVSRALKNKSDISQATREYIQSVANEMGYIRNVAASSLRSGRTKTLGVILGGLSNPYYGVMSDALHNAAADLGYTLLIQCSRDTGELELEATEAAISRQVDGILLFPSNYSDQSINRMRSVNMPFVLMARHMEEGDADCVVCNEEEGAYLATRHLIEQGRKKLAYLSSYEVVYSSAQRKSGFFRACSEAGIEMRTALCRKDEDIHRQLMEWVREGVDGLIVFCDLEAWNAISMLEAEGLKVPQDISVASFDNLQGFLKISYPLCSIAFDFQDMAHSGINLLRQRIHGDDQPPQTIIYPPKLICRGSCGKAR